MLLNRKLQDELESDYAGTCTAPMLYVWAEDKGVKEDDVAETLDYMEIFECVSCGWWLHPGEIYLGHAEDCEGHDEMVCGDCCQ